MTFLLEHFIQTLDVWECSTSQKNSALLHARLLFCDVGRSRRASGVYDETNNEAERKVHESREHTRGNKRAEPLQKPGAKLAAWGMGCSEKKFKKKKEM